MRNYNIYYFSSIVFLLNIVKLKGILYLDKKTQEIKKKLGKSIILITTFGLGEDSPLLIAYQISLRFHFN